MPQDPDIVDRVARAKADAPKTKPRKLTTDAIAAPAGQTTEGQMTSAKPDAIADAPIDHMAMHRRETAGCSPPGSHAGYWVDNGSGNVCSACGRPPGQP